MKAIAVICDQCKERGPIAEHLFPALEKAKEAGWSIEGYSVIGGNLCPKCIEANSTGKPTNREWRIMRGLLLHFHRCILIPRIARMCVLSRDWTDKRLAKVAKMLVLNGGDWAAVKEELMQPGSMFQGRGKFCDWADRVIAGAQVKGGAQ